MYEIRPIFTDRPATKHARPRHTFCVCLAPARQRSMCGQHYHSSVLLQLSGRAFQSHILMSYSYSFSALCFQSTIDNLTQLGTLQNTSLPTDIPGSIGRECHYHRCSCTSKRILIPLVIKSFAPVLPIPGKQISQAKYVTKTLNVLIL